jgi:hypothetical protein
VHLHLVLIVLIAAVDAGCGDPIPAERTPLERAAVEDWKIEPGVRMGALTRNASELDLVRAYGGRNVRDSSITRGEGVTARGTLLYPDDPQRRVEVLWSDAGAKREPLRIVLRGERSRWMLPQEISLGSSLSELERRNGRPFRLSGFGWDYAGAVTSWEGGALDSLLRGVHLYLEPRAEDRAGAAYRRLQGDREFDSENADMKRLDPRVYQITVQLGPEPAAAARSDSSGARVGGK